MGMAASVGRFEVTKIVTMRRKPGREAPGMACLNRSLAPPHKPYTQPNPELAGDTSLFLQNTLSGPKVGTAPAR